MPNRIIKESICTSDTIEKLSWMEEVIFYRLIVTVDDYGRMDARPSILKAKLFPLKSSVTERNITDALKKISSLGLAITYIVEGKPYLELASWSEHQRIRNVREKYPPNGGLLTSCGELPQVAASCGLNPNPNPNPNPYCTEPSDDDSMPNEEIIESITLNDASLFSVTESMYQEWVSLYPSVDVRQQLRSMVGWCNANPTKRKTKAGIKKFINGWLAREQDRGKTVKPLKGLDKDYSEPEDPRLTAWVQKERERLAGHN